MYFTELRRDYFNNIKHYFFYFIKNAKCRPFCFVWNRQNHNFLPVSIPDWLVNVVFRSVSVLIFVEYGFIVCDVILDRCNFNNDTILAYQLLKGEIILLNNFVGVVELKTLRVKILTLTYNFFLLITCFLHLINK